jgi:hypothetical protein
MAEEIRHGVCVVSVRHQAAAPPLVTVSVRRDVQDPHSETRRYSGSRQQILAEVSAFLQALGVPE